MNYVIHELNNICKYTLPIAQHWPGQQVADTHGCHFTHASVEKEADFWFIPSLLMTSWLKSIRDTDRITAWPLSL